MRMRKKTEKIRFYVREQGRIHTFYRRESNSVSESVGPSVGPSVTIIDTHFSFIFYSMTEYPGTNLLGFFRSALNLKPTLNPNLTLALAQLQTLSFTLTRAGDRG